MCAWLPRKSKQACTADVFARRAKRFEDAAYGNAAGRLAHKRCGMTNRKRRKEPGTPQADPLAALRDDNEETGAKTIRLRVMRQKGWVRACADRVRRLQDVPAQILVLHDAGDLLAHVLTVNKDHALHAVFALTLQHW